jgi:hypothetical protein
MACAVGRGLVRRDEPCPTRICLDETSFQKRDEYMRVVTDLDGRRGGFRTRGRASTTSAWRGTSRTR